MSDNPRAVDGGRGTGPNTRCRVITLQNKGFSPLYKSGGKLFAQCVDGKLLMLAPAAWPYLPGKKPMTRMDACVLNRIAQLLSGDGAVEIDYKGVRLDGVEEAVASTTGVVVLGENKKARRTGRQSYNDFGI